MIDLFYEITSTIRRNKMRTFLTGFAVAWGIFMLIVLLGSGNGLSNGFSSNMGDKIINVVQIWGGQTNLPYAGFQAGRIIELNDKDLEFTSRDFGEEVSSVLGNVRVGTKDIKYKSEYISARVTGTSADLTKIEGIKITSGNGRFINDIDIKERRKVIVISQRAKDIMFKKEEALGKNIVMDGIVYTVVGIYYIQDQDNITDAYIPVSTAGVIYKKGKTLSNLAFILSPKINTKEINEDFMNRYKERFARQHQISPKDDGAIWYWNKFTNYLELASVSTFINIAVWIIGIFTLISGIVGVSNIMLITVRERTREFGIRKSIGASPWSILRLVILESIVITTIFGYIGLVCGVGITEVAGMFFKPTGGGMDNPSVFVNPTVDIATAINATILLIIAGTLAGFFPALKAVKIKTIDALNDK